MLCKGWYLLHRFWYVMQRMIFIGILLVLFIVIQNGSEELQWIISKCKAKATDNFHTITNSVPIESPGCQLSIGTRIIAIREWSTAFVMLFLINLKSLQLIQCNSEWFTWIILNYHKSIPMSVFDEKNSIGTRIIRIRKFLTAFVMRFCKSL